jgi:hypothetical protein
MISALDAAIGKIVTTLKTTGQYNNTVIVFSSDSGSGNLNQMEKIFNPQERLPLNLVSFKTIGTVLNQRVKNKGSSSKQYSYMRFFFEMSLG